MSANQVEMLDHAAVTFAVLGLLLYQEPKASRIEGLLQDDFFARLPFAGDNPLVVEGQQELQAWVKAAVSHSVDESLAELKREWLRLLVGYGEPEAPPWAAYYYEKDPVIFGQKTLEVRRWYARYGLELERKYKEPDDHLGIMLQFLSTLIAKECETIRAGDSTTALEIAVDQEKFLKTNVTPWVGHWQALMTDAAKSPFYRGIALLIHGALQTYSPRFS
ncbi:MAG: molecular chaperone TorD family protein [Coriobacteriales bacterium]|jgi:TorA maturation chaperone TorD|nr:molecular chaperone TorD family protein [Coriobacteriales bacterium]